MDNSVIVSLKDIVVDFDGETVLDGLNLDIHDKEFVTFLGPSGCGKTTTLRVIGGFIEPKSGNVFFNGKDITSLPPYKRQVNTVFQKYALFPHLNVYDNVAFGLRLKKVDEKEVRQRVMEMLEMVGLKGFERRSTVTLSGGQQQRVAIARALANNPRIMLCDEATSALDTRTTVSVLNLLAKINKELGVTLVVITHSLAVARHICDRVAVIDEGVIVEEGPTRQVLENPQSEAARELVSFDSLEVK